MPEQSLPPLVVILDRSSTDEDSQAVADVLAEVGIPIEMLTELRESEIPLGDIQQLAWSVVMSTPIQTFLTIYCALMAKKFAGHTDAALEHLFTKLWKAGKARS